MPFDLQRAKQQLQAFDLRALFIQNMGWDRANQRLEIPIDGERAQLSAIAQKRGMTAFEVAPLTDGKLPNYAERRKIEAQVRKSVHEHILIFSDGKTRQVWQWVRREPGRPTTGREFEVTKGQSGEALANHLKDMVFSLEEEEQIGIVDVTSRVRAAFDVERVTRRFYERFKDEHAGLLGFLQGIPDEEMQRWYVSVTMNRLMFVYFIQKKGFLNGDYDYLRNRLLESKFREPDRFYSDFLCPLFFEGFARKERSEEIKQLLGNVPYLNGGIFQKHEIEKAHERTIQIPDRAFERVFDFFDQYRWHLDERPLRNDTEINPDVLGYIFEKYINQREMGAYYTKEDITGYISKSTVLPYLLDQARKDCAIAFNGEHAVWRLLQSDPERYIYDAVKKGCQAALPAEIAAGIDDVAQRGAWNRAATEEFALPTETWREAVARRERFEAVRGKLAAGEVRAVDELITYNLDIQQFTQDVVEESEGPELLRAFWKGLRGMRVLDPTCGSGAFLFAALNMLEPLYEACLERMQAFVSELDADGAPHRPEKYADFRKVLEEVGKHPNRRYFILKSIIVNNLYGVDIMEEAVEICKLRLFLKLIAQIEKAEQIEPLPDIDFNIRAGNTLVGFTSLEEVRQAMSSSGGQLRFLYPEEEEQIRQIEEEAELASRAFERFQEQQLEQGFVKAEDKEALRGRLENLNQELNRALAKSYAVDPDSLAFGPWLTSHKPFHWYVEFYAIMKQGGFDVIIGNPPYVEYSKVKKEYTVLNYSTESCGNLFAFTYEVVLKIMRYTGRSGLIIPVASTCTDGYLPLRKLWQEVGNVIVSFYNDRPGKLFDGLEHIRLSIVLIEKIKNKLSINTTKYNRWRTIERSSLFSTMWYGNATMFANDSTYVKISTPLEESILKKILTNVKTLGHYSRQNGLYNIFYTRKLSSFVQILDFIPKIIDNKGELRKPSELKEIGFDSQTSRDVLLALLNSNLFYWYLTIQSDCRNLNRREVLSMRFDLDNANTDVIQSLSLLSKKLMEQLDVSSKLIEMKYEGLGKIKIQCLYPKLAKNVIDEIDNALAQHYGFNERELDFIINYDIKYRMGAEE